MKPRSTPYQPARGERQEARILALLKDGPKTAHELSDLMHLARSNVQKYLTRLMTKPHRRVRVADIMQSPGRPRLMYGLGNGPDATIKNLQRKRVLAGVKDMSIPSGAREIASHMDMQYSLIIIYLRELRAAKKIYIAEWGFSNITPMPRYKVGDKEDAPRPTTHPRLHGHLSYRPASIFASLGLP